MENHQSPVLFRVLIFLILLTFCKGGRRKLHYVYPDKTEMVRNNFVLVILLGRRIRYLISSFAKYPFKTLSLTLKKPGNGRKQPHSKPQNGNSKSDRLHSYNSNKYKFQLKMLSIPLINLTM